jgi:nitroreductase
LKTIRWSRLSPTAVWNAGEGGASGINDSGQKEVAAGRAISQASFIKKEEGVEVSVAIRERRSVRSYRDTEVEEEKLAQVLEAGRLSPSAANRQEWKFIVVRSSDTRKKLSDAACGQSFVGQAPVVIVACAVENQAIMPCGQPAYTVDLSIAFAYMILQACELGLGTCWIGAFMEDEVKKILNIPEPVRIVAMSPLGYPAHNIPPRPRKNLEEIICYEAYA